MPLQFPNTLRVVNAMKWSDVPLKSLKRYTINNIIPLYILLEFKKTTTSVKDDILT